MENFRGRGSAVEIGAVVAGEHLVEIGDGRARAFRMGPDRADDREKIGAGFDQRPTILLGDADAPAVTPTSRARSSPARLTSSLWPTGGGGGAEPI